MDEAGDAGLFAALPEQAAAERGRGGTPRLRRPERTQVELVPAALDDLLPAEHRARMVWAFVERLDLSPLYALIKAVAGGPGRPPADPQLLVALWLYATVEGVGSARALARLCEEQIGFRWLAGGVSLNHHSLADFRVAHGAVLERLLIDGFTAMLATGQASLEEVAQDGVRVRAAAGAASFRRRARLQRLRAAAAARVAALRTELEADPGASRRRQAAARQRAAAERLARVDQALAAMAALTGGAGRDDAGPEDGPGAPAGTARGGPGRAPRVSTTDPQARVMKMADGGFRPAWNAQLVADTKTSLIAAVEVDSRGSDQPHLLPMSDKLAADYGRRPERHLVDGGFVRLEAIARLAEAGSAVYAPVPEPRDEGRDRHAPKPDDPPAVAAWRQRMGGDEARAIYKHRAATAELVNAQARNRGLIRLLVRGQAKVKAVLLWFALAHNMAVGWRLAAPA
jgi:transposase